MAERFAVGERGSHHLVCARPVTPGGAGYGSVSTEDTVEIDMHTVEIRTRTEIPTLSNAHL